MCVLRVVVGGLLLASWMSASVTWGQTFNWTGGGTTDNWTEGNNWGGTAPTPGAEVRLRFGGSASNFNMVNDFASPSWHRLQFLASGYSLSGNSLSLVQNGAGDLPIVNGFANTSVSTDWTLVDELQYLGSTATDSFTYSGTISGGSALNLWGGFTLAAGGMINNSGAINITSNSGTVTVDGTIGSGGNLTIDNSRILAGTGVINRNIIMPGAADFTSTGTLTINGDIAISNAPNNLLAGTLEVNGLLELNSGGFQMSAGTILSGNGDLSVTGGGSAFINGTVTATKNIELSGILFPVFISGSGTIDGNVSVDGNHQVIGNLTLNQNLTFSNANAQAMLGSSGDTLTINGLTTVEMGSNVRLEGIVGGPGSLVLESGSNFQMAGQLDMDLTVRGTLNGIGGSGPINNALTAENAILIGLLNVQNTLTVQTAGFTELQAGGDLTVTGLTTIQDGGFRVDSAAIMNAVGSAVVQSNAVLNVNGMFVSSLVEMDATTTLSGAGLVEGAVSLDGLLDPGNSAGTLGIKGSVDLGGTSTVCIEIGGSSPGSQFDVVDGQGTSTMELGNSFLQLSLINGFIPETGDEFLFLRNFASISGFFGNTGGNGGFGDSAGRIHFNDGSFGIDYDTGAVRLFDFQAVPEPSIAGLLGGWLVLLAARRSMRPRQELLS